MKVYEVLMHLMTIMESLGEKKQIVLKALLVLVACTLAVGIIGTALSSLHTNSAISNVGTVRGVRVGIYRDSACTNLTSSINWGLLDPGSNKTVMVYVRNEGNVVATLSKAAGNWSPSNAANYMTLKWNYANQTLGVNQVLQIQLTLVVSSTISGVTSFSFDITITATG